MTWVLLCGLAFLAGLAQWYKVTAERLATEVLITYQWIDEIIEALESKDEAAGNERVDRLVDQRLPDGRPRGDQR